MSIQLTWLATNMVPPGKGAPTARRRKPNTRIRPADHARTIMWSSRWLPTRMGPNSGLISTSTTGRWTSRCHSNIGTRYR